MILNCRGEKLRPLIEAVSRINKGRPHIYLTIPFQSETTGTEVRFETWSESNDFRLEADRATLRIWLF